MRRLAVAAALLLAGSCGNGSDSTATLRVSAASSLSEAFTALGASFEGRHPAVDVVFNFAASSALAQQIGEGAPADVLVTADERTMEAVVGDGLAAAPVVIARNRLAMLVEPGNPKGIGGLADLVQPGVRFVMCAPATPCGRFAAAALARSGVIARPASLEENVKAVVARVSLGEADAGIVYATDVRAAAGRAEGVSIDVADDPELEAVYPMALVGDGPGSVHARRWVAFVRSPAGQRVLQRFGFLAP